jgi:hypothetical protein
MLDPGPDSMNPDPKYCPSHPLLFSCSGWQLSRFWICSHVMWVPVLVGSELVHIQEGLEYWTIQRVPNTPTLQHHVFVYPSFMFTHLAGIFFRYFVCEIFNWFGTSVYSALLIILSYWHIWQTLKSNLSENMFSLNVSLNSVFHPSVRSIILWI